MIRGIISLKSNFVNENANNYRLGVQSLINLAYTNACKCETRKHWALPLVI